MKYLLFIFAFSISSLSFSQVISENNPWTQGFALELKNNASQNTALKKGNIKPTLERISSQFNTFWRQKDYSKKGSGYKPFKRWEQHWSHYLMEDGTIAPPSVLWNAWREKIALESTNKGSKNNPQPNWTNIGPAVVANTATKTAGQGRVNAIALDPSDANTIYIGAPAGGIWKSTNNGVDWTPLADHLPQIGVSGIAIDPNNSNIIYISTGDDDAGDSYSIGVLKSIDGGENWNTTGLTFNFNYKGSNEIFIDPTDSNIVWVATSEGLYKTTDAGDLWTNVLQANIRDFRLKPGDPLTVYAVSDKSNSNTSKFYKSTDGGVQFEEIASAPTESKRLAIEVTAADPTIIYMLSSYDNGDGTRAGSDAFQGLYKSTDSGTTFVQTQENDDIFASSQSWYDMALTVSDTDPNIVFVGVLDIWKSIDGGDNFTKNNSWYIHNNQFTHADIHFLRYFNNVLYAGTDGGIYRSENDGTLFEDLSTNLSISQLYTISVSKTTSQKIAGGLQDCGGFAYSENEWNSYHGGDGMGSAIDPAFDNHYYGLTQYGGYLFKNTGGGNANSTQVASSPEDQKYNEWVIPLQFSKNSELYAGYSQLFKLNNTTWSAVSSHDFGNSDLDHIEISTVNSDVIYVSQANTLFKSNDKGKTFTQILTTNNRIQSIEAHTTNGNILWVIDYNKVLKSTDGGATFSDITGNLPSESKRIIKHQPYSTSNALFVGTSLGVYYIDDSKDDWSSFSGALPNVAITDIEINIEDNIISAATYGRGIWQSPLPSASKPTTDIDLYDVFPDDSNYSCDSESTLLINVHNNGTDTITNFNIVYNINNTSNETIAFEETILAGQSAEISLPNLEALNIGDNSLYINVVLSSDQYPENNERTMNISKNTLNTTSESNNLKTFEDSVEDNWIVVGDQDVWSIAEPNGTKLNSAGSGTKAYTTNPDGDYNSNKTAELVSPCYDLTTVSSPVLKFNMAYDLEANYDYLFLEYSINKGTSWVNLGTYNGDASTLTEYTFDLENLTNEANIIFRYRFVTDALENDEGVVLDDFIIEGNTLSIADNTQNVIGLYPNPSNGSFTMTWNPNSEKGTLEIYNVLGSMILKQDLDKGEQKVDLNLTKEASGIYFIKLKVGDQIMYKKLMLNNSN